MKICQIDLVWYFSHDGVSWSHIIFENFILEIIALEFRGNNFSYRIKFHESIHLWILLIFRINLFLPINYNRNLP